MFWFVVDIHSWEVCFLGSVTIALAGVLASGGVVSCLPPGFFCLVGDKTGRLHFRWLGLDLSGGRTCLFLVEGKVQPARSSAVF